ncbi:MAG: zinc-ribbon domain-containing protein [Clostridia bacterium]|nr:zinc-ribbon domain-containing protein [Clostridia bacterium]
MAEKKNIASNNRPKGKYGSLAETNPDLLVEWHPTKNEGLLPTEVTQKSGRLVWWLGKCGHEWQSKVYIRTSGHGCPYCSNVKVLPGFNDLATKNPNLAKEWHPNKNGDLKPDMFASTSNKKVWWLGVCGHEWQATINSRHFGNGCPVCANQQVLSGYNDLATKNPNLAKEWHQTKNGEISSTMVSPKSSKRAWWICEKGHEWQSRVADRASGKGCPYCANVKVLPKYNDLETKESNIVHEWHPTKNGNLKPDMITDGSRKAVWWLCEKGHEWQATVTDRVRGRGCPICANQRMLSGYNDLETRHPLVAREWHPTKNGELTPYMIAPKSGKKVWWMCEKGHEWQALVSDRTNGIGCPICSKETHTSFPEQVLFYYIKLYFPDVVSGNRERIGLELDIYIPSMNIAVEYDGYNWHKDNLNERRKNQLCKENDIFLIRVRENGLELFDDCCCIVRKDRKHNSSLNQIAKEIFSYIDNTIEIDVDVDRDESKIYESYILTTKSKSLESTYPQIAQEWHPTKNGQLKPDMVTFGSGKRVWWICEKGHEWQAGVNWRVQGNGCPVCANQQILSGYNDLETKYPLVAKEWHPTKNGELTPNMVASRSSKKAWWMCEKGHEWEASISSRTDGRGCPICANKRILPGYNDLATKNPKLAREWHPTKNADLKPNMIAPGSNKKVWWMCKEGHEWQAKVNDRSNGTNCPFCRKRKKDNG